MDISEVSLFEVVGDQTQERHSATATVVPVNNDDFDTPEPEVEEVEVVEEDPYDAEVEASKLVNLINAGNIIALTPIAHFRLKKVRGGKSALEKMKIAYEKEIAGKVLTDEDKKWIEKFAVYKSDLSMLNNEIQFTPKQKEVLITAAIPFCESNKLKVNDSFAFYGILAGFEITKIMKILAV